MPPELSEVYSGRQIFHDRGGHLVVGMTDRSRADTMRQYLAQFGLDDVEIRPFSASQDELDQTVREATALVRESRRDGKQPMIEIGRRQLGKVTVRVARGELNGNEAAMVATARANPDLYSVLEVEHITDSHEEACDFTDDIECDPPLRGSVRIFDGGICTAAASHGLPFPPAESEAVNQRSPRRATNGGDSGSPYFAYGVAYGIHSSGDGVSGSSGCEFGRAEHAPEASSRMNVFIITL